MPETFALFESKLDQIQREITGVRLRAVTTRVMTKTKTSAIGAIHPNTLSHWGRGKKGAKVKARFDIITDSSAKLYPTIPPLAALLESGSGTSWKRPRRKGAKRRKKGSVGKYSRARVPSRHAWSNAIAKVVPDVPSHVHDEVNRVLREVFH